MTRGSQAQKAPIKTAAPEGDTSGTEFSRGALYHMLRNPVYRGLIRHKSKLHPGLHPPIIDEGLFDAVQDDLASRRVKRSTRSVRAAKFLLTGRVFLPGGIPLTPSFSYGKRRRQYRYYITGKPAPADHPEAQPPQRIPASSLENFIKETLERLAGTPGADWELLDTMLVSIEVRPQDTHIILDSKLLFGDEHPQLAHQNLQSRLKPSERILVEPGYPDRLRVTLGVPMRFRGGQAWLIDAAHAGDHSTPYPDPTLIAGLRAAPQILRKQGIDVGTRRFEQHAQAPEQSYQRKLCLLALLAPDLQTAILEGRLPRNVTLHRLVAGDPPLLWRHQPAWVASHK